MHQVLEDEAYGVSPVRTRVSVFVVSPVRVYREGLVRALGSYPAFTVPGAAETCEQALLALVDQRVDVVLYDLRCPSGVLGVRVLAGATGARVVALGVEESEERVIACAEAGIAGYVTDACSLDELVARVTDAARGDFSCPPHIAAGLLRRLAAGGPAPVPDRAGPRLTDRELEVAVLLQAGLTNRQIASRLCIQLPTVKNHVHNILRKLDSPTRRDAVAALGATRVTVPAARVRPRPRQLAERPARYCAV